MTFVVTGVRARVRQALVALTGAAVAVALVAEGLDTAFAPTTAGVVVSGAVVVLALWVPVERLTRHVVLAVAASCALSVVSTRLAERPEHTPGMTELCALLLIVARVFRRCSIVRATVLAAGAAVAAVLLPLRISAPGYAALNLVEPAVLCGLVLAAVLGLCLRLRDSLRAREREAIRQAQRLEYARDLHDFVAHHVTAIVAQTKAVRFVSEAGRPPEPADLDRMLAGIEHAGAQALASMRAMVSVLRDGAPAPTGPAGRLSELLPGMAADFSAAGPRATVAVDPRLSRRRLPPEITEVVHRVVQESLTNVRKHSHAATGVTIEARIPSGVSDGFEVSVADDGRPGPGRAGRGEAGSAGFGLLGLAERVRAVGGRMTSGCRTDGPGWRVLARLPLDDGPRQDVRPRRPEAPEPAPELREP